MTACLLTVRSGRVHLEGCIRIRTDDAWPWSPANDGPGVATPCPHCLPAGLPSPARTTPAEAIAEYTAGVQRARDAKEDDAIHASGRCVQCGKGVGATRLCGPCRGIKKRQAKP